MGREQPFPDHHVFSARDFAERRGTLLMTEKDAIKCTGLGLTDAWYLPVEAALPAAFEQDFLARTRAMLGGR
ncbi:tetraacyldisaccharide 4'-kinase [compost metagenome]